MNRRDLFRFAVGGIVGAPAMLIGDKLAAGSVEYVTGVSEVIEPPVDVHVHVSNAEGDARIRDIVRQQVRLAIEEHHGRGSAFHAMRKA